MKNFHFEYDAAHEVFVVRMYGRITDDIFKASYAATPQYLEGRRIRAALMDLSGVDSYDVSSAAMRDVSKLPPLFPDPTPRWIVAPQDHIFGMARMFQMLSPTGRDMLHVVRSMRDALQAMGGATAHFERLPDL
ncbi:MAG TPA: hypothetical protein VFP91_01985 [Vicinamibacterales bacterium]|nr:hypothetical protein [Vicinamibacterales bacterium]